MDFSKYQKISSDEKTTCLKHPDGHEIKIAHQALNPKMRDQLHKLPVHMAEGGTVEKKSDQPVINVNLGPEIAGALQPNLQASAQDFASMPNANLKDPFQEKVDLYKKQFPAEVATGALNPEEKALMDIEAGNAAKLKSAEEEKLALAGAGQKTLELAQRKQAAGVALTPQESQALTQTPEVDPRQAQFDELQKMINQPSSGQPQQGSALNTGLGQYESGLKQEAAAAGELAQRQAQIKEQQNMLLQEKLKPIEEDYALKKAEYEALSQDFKNGQIDPKAYLNKMSGGQRMMTAIGLFMGGLGGGLLGTGKNPALDFLNAQIDRDISAQEKDLNNKGNLLNMNLKEMGNIKDAMEMTRIQSKEAIASMLDIEALKMTDKIKQAQAQQAAGKIRLENMDKLGALYSNRAQGILGEIQRLPKDLQGPAIKELGDYKGIQSSVKEANRIMDQMSNLSMADRYAPGSNRVGTLEAGLTKIAKTILGEAFNENDFARLVKPFSSGVFTTKAQEAAARRELISALQSQVPGKAPILSETGIVSDQTKYNFTPRK